MRRILIGITTSLAVWLGSTMVAEAQGGGITPNGPTKIHTGDTSATYTADITIPSLQDYAVQLYLYRGANPTPIQSFEVWFYNPTSLTSTFSQACCISPAALLGQKYTFKANLILTNPSQTIAAANLVITVSAPGTYLIPSKPRDYGFAAIERDRRHEA
jgi:hypothetical protein